MLFYAMGRSERRDASRKLANCTAARIRKLFRFGCSLGLAACLTSAGAGAQQLKLVVLPIEFLKADYFPDAHRINAEERARLGIVAELVRERLRREDYDVVAADVTADAVVRADPGAALHQCTGCERDIGASVGAQWVLVGWIQMVSNLIVNLNMVAYDVETGRRVAQAFVDLRGNTERSWRRATEYLLKRLLVERLNAARDALK